MSAEKILERLESGTLDKAVDAIDQALTYQGDNPKFMDKGKLGASTLGSYKGILGAQTNRERLQFDRDKRTKP